MKTTILMMFSFIFITGSIFGQIDKHNYIDSDIRNQFLPIKNLNSAQLRRPYLNTPKKFDFTSIGDIDKFGLYHASSLFKDNNVRLYSDFEVVEEFPKALRSYCYPFVRTPDTRGKIVIIKPDTSENIKYHLIIKDSIHNTITK